MYFVQTTNYINLIENRSVLVDLITDRSEFTHIRDLLIRSRREASKNLPPKVFANMFDNANKKN